jgi:general secretion pathway protein N
MRHLTLGLVAYGVFLVVMLPASFVVAQVERLFPGRVQFGSVEGTAWRGAASVRAGAVTIDKVEWRLLPSGFLRGRVAYATSFALPGFSGTADIARRFSGWRIDGLNAEGDAGVLAMAMPILTGARPSGRVTATGSAIEIDRDDARGEATVEWRDAATALAEVRPLGSYRASWRDGALHVETLQGPLRIVAEGTAKPPMRVLLRGEARAEPQAAKTLAPVLDALGPARPDGAHSFELRVD